jgi:hypothetical protein
VRVFRCGGWYRAATSGERVTLASLYRKGILERQAWRGNEGDSNTAHEYKVSFVVRSQLKGGRAVPLPERS